MTMAEAVATAARARLHRCCSSSSLSSVVVVHRQQQQRRQLIQLLLLPPLLFLLLLGFVVAAETEAAMPQDEGVESADDEQRPPPPPALVYALPLPELFGGRGDSTKNATAFDFDDDSLLFGVNYGYSRQRQNPIAFWQQQLRRGVGRRIYQAAAADPHWTRPIGWLLGFGLID